MLVCFFFFFFFAKKKKRVFFPHEPVHISMWTHFCHIALCAKPNFWLFVFSFFFLVARKKIEKIGCKVAKKVPGQKHYKKEFPHFALFIFEKKKKEKKSKSIAPSFFWSKVQFVRQTFLA